MLLLLALLLELPLALLRLRLLQALLLQLRRRGLRRGGARELLLLLRRGRPGLLRAVANVSDGHLWLVRGGAVGGERGHVKNGRREAVAVVVLHGGRGLRRHEPRSGHTRRQPPKHIEFFSHTASGQARAARGKFGWSSS